MPYKILVVEDDPTIQRELVTLLQAEGYEAAAVVDFSTTLSQVNTVQPHLILLDIKLPGQSGFSLCSQIRAFSTVPIIFVTSCNTDMDELSSILLGGDAFITKPYHTAILLAKIAALLRRAYPDQPGQVLTYGGAELHLERSQLLYQGQAADLTKNELKILYYLFKHAGTICARMSYALLFQSGNLLLERFWSGASKALIMFLYFLILILLTLPGILIAVFLMVLLNLPGGVSGGLLVAGIINIPVALLLLYLLRDMLQYAEYNR